MKPQTLQKMSVIIPQFPQTIPPNFPPKLTRTTLFPPNLPKYPCNKIPKLSKISRWVVKSSVQQVEENAPKSKVDIKKLVGFLYEDLPHLFDDQGIDATAYDERVMFRDPITKHDTISGYLFNISFLKLVFQPNFELHWAKQTGPYEITTRWTMVMKFMPLPWKPELVFTGTSVMGINPETGKFCSHVDYWDSIKANDYFSLEGLWEVFKQLRMYKTPDLETPKYQILKRAADYEVSLYGRVRFMLSPLLDAKLLPLIHIRNPKSRENVSDNSNTSSVSLDNFGPIFFAAPATQVRKYEPFIVVETQGDKLSGSAGFNSVAGYIFGKNSKEEKIPMTTPVFTETTDPEDSKVAIQIVIPQDKNLGSLPNPSQEAISLREVEGRIVAALKFSGKPTEEVVREKERQLRASLTRDGLRPRKGCLLARYNDPGRTWDFIMLPGLLGIWSGCSLKTSKDFCKDVPFLGCFRSLFTPVPPSPPLPKVSPFGTLPRRCSPPPPPRPFSHP
ncbi:hypothetical protein KSS87_013689 [Heliosperma pusillum]|nr:hypothetical protein KSS87_013689 [Heliosperma pusillum]